jgi:hypothetical protein
MKKLVERIKSRSVEVGECWEWRGAKQHQSTTPMINYNRRSMSVMRALAKNAGKEVTGLVATTSCRNPMCVNPAHLVLLSRGDLLVKVSGEQQFQKRTASRLAVSNGSKRRKLSHEAVKEIRNSQEDRGALALTYGVTRSHINAIISGHRRALTPNNVFAGLMP